MYFSNWLSLPVSTELFPTSWILLEFQIHFFSNLNPIRWVHLPLKKKSKNKIEIIRRQLPQPPIPKVTNLYETSLALSFLFLIRKNHFPLELQKVHFSVHALHSLLPIFSGENQLFPLCVFNLSVSTCTFLPLSFYIWLHLCLLKIKFKM